MRRSTFFLLAFLIGVGTLAGIYATVRRYSVESKNRRVELVLDFDEVRRLAQVTGQPLPVLLARFKAVGITSLAITEETLSDLEQEGALRIGKTRTGYSATVATKPVFHRIASGLGLRGLKLRTGSSQGEGTGEGTLFALSAPNGLPVAGFRCGADFPTIRVFGIGPDPDATAVIQQAGMNPVGRIANYPGVSPSTMVRVLQDLKARGIRTVIYQGTDVLGYRGQSKEAAEAHRQAGVQYGQVEFGKQKGDEPLAAALKGEYVRVHSISEGEMATLDESEIIDRFVRAARERNIRLCYVRLLTFAGLDPVQMNVEYLDKITRRIARGREFQYGPAHLFGETHLPTWVFGLIAAGVAGGAVLLLTRLVPMSTPKTLLALSLLLVIVVMSAVLLSETGRKLVALLAALVFPTLACLRRDVLPGADEENARAYPPSPSGAVRYALKGLASACAVTSLGIIAVIGLLATRPFMLKANQFMGIKIAHALPLLLIGALAVTGLPRLDRSWPLEWERMKQRVSRYFSEPTRVGQLLMAIVALAALAMIVARTGNEPGVGVSGIEMKFRAVMDRTVPVRPRTKEFLLGHPAFVLALALWYRGRRRWALPLFVVGVIGQVSLLNTFCHIHTPLYLSLVRAFSGLILGAFVGLAAFWISEKIACRQPVRERDPLGSQAL